jgi:hypothetical protein
MYWQIRFGVSLWLALATCAPLSHSAEAPKQTSFVNNESMEVPGMMLGPGRYVLRLIEPATERNVLQIFEVVQLWTGDESRVLTTLLTMPNYDLPTTDKTVFAFFERGPKQAKALRLWFAPGRNYGQEFVYPKAQAVELAKTVGRGVLSLPPELPGDIGMFAGGVKDGSEAPVRTPVSALLAQPPTSHPSPFTPPANQPPPQPAASPALPGPSTAVSALPRTELQRDGSGSAPRIQSRSRASDRAAVREPHRIADSLPKTASYLSLSALLGTLGIVGGVLLRILALRLDQP